MSEENANSCLADGTCPEAEIKEVLTSDQAIIVIFAVVIISAIAGYLYFKREEYKQKKDKFSVSYNFRLPQEVKLYEDMMCKEPEENNPMYPNWHKAVCTVLMRRAIMDVSLYTNLMKDFNRQNQLYKSGITMDSFELLKKHKKEMEAEIALVQQEAELLRPGWGRVIFKHAQEQNQHIMMMQKKKEEAEKQMKQAKAAEKKKIQDAAEAKRREEDKKKNEAIKREKLQAELIREEEEAAKRKSKKKIASSGSSSSSQEKKTN